MAEQFLRDAAVEPTDEGIAEALGTANSAYLQFMEEVKNHGVEVGWRYYNDGKAWLGKALYKWTTSRGTPKEMTAFWLSIWDGFFRVGFMFPEKKREALLALSLAPETRKMAEEAQQMGKLKLFSLGFDLRSNEQFGDVFTLVEFKKTIK